MSRKLKWGVIGLGGIAGRTIPEGIAGAQNAQLSAIFDIDQQVNAEVAKESGAEQAASINQLLDTDIDAIYVTTPTHVHAEQVRACAEAGKHVLCEKPLGMTIAEAENMIELCDALRWFARSPVEEVSAFQTRTDNPAEYPGTISINMKFKDGKIERSTTTFDAKMPYRFNIGICGSEGTLRNNEIFAPKLFPGQNDFMKIPCILPDSGDVTHHPFQGEVSHFLDCIIDDLKPYPDLDDAAKTQAVCFAADRSAESGRPVPVSEFENLL